MKSHINDKRGFAGIEAILLIIVVALLAAVGILVYQKQNTKTTPSKSATTTTSTATTTSTTGWKTFTDTTGVNLSFQYPDTWDASADDALFGFAGAVSPSSSQAFYDTPNSVDGGKVHLTLNFVAGSDANPECDSDCKLVGLVPLHIASATTAKLAIYNEVQSDTNITRFQVTDDSAATIGATSFKESVTIGGSQFQIVGFPTYSAGNAVAADTASAHVNNENLFEQSADFKTLVALLDTLSVK